MNEKTKVTASIEGNDLVIRIPAFTKNPPLSKSLKTLTVASSNGFAPTDAQVEGKQVFVNLNAYVRK